MKVDSKRITVRVTPEAERQIRAGHPWLFEGSIRHQNFDGSAGDLAVIFDRKKRFLAIGLYDPHSTIRIRILHHGEPRTIDASWLRQQVLVANQRRAPLFDSETDGYRIVHGENDGLPGLVIDRYAECLVIKLYSSSWFPHMCSLIKVVQGLFHCVHVVLRLSRTVQMASRDWDYHDGQILLGNPNLRTTNFLENGLTFEVDPVRGQKTGFFLDQRENRALVGRHSHSKSVLNVFAYTGGFSVYAARGGARHVISLDASHPALESATRNFELNRHVMADTHTKHDLMHSDAFQGLSLLKQLGKSFDLVVIDPPAFAKKSSEKKKALEAYYRLAQQGLSVLNPCGMFVMASCSSRVDMATFARTVFSAATHVNRPIRELMRTGHALDHPVGFKEGEYLKCIYAQAVN